MWASHQRARPVGAGRALNVVQGHGRARQICLIGAGRSIGSASRVPVRLGQIDRQCLDEMLQLVREVGVCVEVEVPSVARKNR
jgi:hypothetical protein